MSGGVREVNFDGLVGPTHNYAGLSRGNVASGEHGGRASSPRRAALQGLEKMMALARLGLAQAVLPPQERPHVPTLRRLGFAGSDEAVLRRAGAEAPRLLAGAASASSMWAANAATVSPFPDTADGRTHFTPANLATMWHRAIEPETTAAVLARVFAGDGYVHHPPLPAGRRFADEGAANHTRFCADHGEPGVALFVHGDDAAGTGAGPRRFPARQTLAACRAVARAHGLDPARVVFARQHPDAIDAGVFHNDVIAVGDRRLLFCHEQAFADNAAVRRRLERAMGAELDWIEAPKAVLTLEEAVGSYLFNSQLLSAPGRPGRTLVAPAECLEAPGARAFLEALKADSPLIDDVVHMDLRQSMDNGGGPACLRLRVVMSEAQIAAAGARVFLDEALHRELEAWVGAHYRDRLVPDDLRDPALLEEGRAALDALTGILDLGPVYEFQRG